jgi:predicted HicB family RNase H-like nuclease
MARPPSHKLTLTVPKHIIDRAKRAAKHQAVDLSEFLRNCIEGRLNQIEATKRYWGNGE